MATPASPSRSSSTSPQSGHAGYEGTASVSPVSPGHAMPIPVRTSDASSGRMSMASYPVPSHFVHSAPLSTRLPWQLRQRTPTRTCGVSR